MAGKDFKEMVNGKSFRIDNSNIIYTFIKDSDTLDISGGAQVTKVHFSFWESEIHSLLETDPPITNERLAYQILSFNSPISFKLWGQDSRKVFGIFTEI